MSHPVRGALVGLVAVGGALGATLRWWLGDLLGDTVDHDFPWTLLAVNLLGAALLAALTYGSWLAGRDSQVRDRWRVFLGPGLLGGFTSVSAFSAETLLLARGDAPWLALVYVLVTVGGGLLAVTAVARVATAGGRS